jgi:hypothetical protein
VVDFLLMLGDSVRHLSDQSTDVWFAVVSAALVAQALIELFSATSENGVDNALALLSQCLDAIHTEQDEPLFVRDTTPLGLVVDSIEHLLAELVPDRLFQRVFRVPERTADEHVTQLFADLRGHIWAILVE